MSSKRASFVIILKFKYDIIFYEEQKNFLLDKSRYKIEINQEVLVA